MGNIGAGHRMVKKRATRGGSVQVSQSRSCW